MENIKILCILLSMALAMNSNTIYASSKNKKSDGNVEQPSKSETQGARANWNVEFYEYVVITKRDLIPAFNKLLTWKKQKGLNAGAVAVEDILNDPAAVGGDLISGINDDAGKIRQYLRASKDSIGKSGKVSKDRIGKYVLLGGMGDIVPFRYACGNDNSWINKNNDAKIPSDFYFSQLDGNWNKDKDEFYGEYNDDDILPNVKDPLYLYVGRLLCRTIDDVERWTRKQLLYEQNPGLGDYDYLVQALITRSDGLNDNVTGKVNNLLPSSMTPTTIKETPDAINPIGPSGESIINLINENHYGLLFNTNHGSPWGYAVATVGYNEYKENSKMFVLARDSYDEIYKKNGEKVLFTAKHELRNGFNNLTNYNHPAVFFSNSCDNIPFDDYDNYYRDYGMRNLGEAFLCENEGGGIAYLGNTRVGYNDESAVKNLLLLLRSPDSSFVKRLGELEYKLKTSAVLGARGGYPWIIRTHNLAGCPETYFWKELPKKFGNITVSSDGIGNLWVNNVNLNNAIVCVTSANDGGVSYRKTSKISSSNKTPEFTNVPNDYVVVVTLDGYIPFIYHSNECTIQKETFTGTEKRDCKNIVAGAHVTTSKPEGDVVIKSGANVTFDAQNTTRIEGGFQVELGGQLKIK